MNLVPLTGDRMRMRLTQLDDTVLGTFILSCKLQLLPPVCCSVVITSVDSLLSLISHKHIGF